MSYFHVRTPQACCSNVPKLYLERVTVALPLKRVGCEEIWVHTPHHCADELLGI
jgi:hypothetical protein